MLVEMKKLVLIAHSARRNRILRALHRSKLVEISATREIENTEVFDNSDRLEKLNEKLGRVSSVLQFMYGEKKSGLKLVKEIEKNKESDIDFEYQPIKGVPFQTIATISYEEFTNIPATEVELLAHISDIEKIQSRYNEINSLSLKSNTFIDQLEVYLPIDVKFSTFCDTKSTSVVLGTVSVQQKSQLEEIINNHNDAQFEVYDGIRFIPFSFVCLKEETDSIMSELQALEFSQCNFDFKHTAKELLEIEKEKLVKFDNEKIELMRKALAKESFIADWKQLYDYYLIEIAKQTAAQGFRCTNSVFVLEAWYPAVEEERITAILNDCCDEVVYEFREPEDNEIIPTLVKSKKLFEPYEDVTNMYSAPNYREDFDPNPIMAFFYFLFFGMMLADAGYGLLLAIGGFVLYKLKKPTPGKGRLLLVITMGGVSTIIWGALFGGWFAFDLGTSFLNKIVWFKPLDEPILMLGLCLALGFLQVVVGMGCNAYNLIRKHRSMDAVFEIFTWFMAFIGLGILVLNSILWKLDALKTTATVLILVGLAGLVLGNARGKKGVGGKIMGALGGVGKLYNGVNILSDVLSYSRLFGLGLAGGVVGMVVNKICGVIIGLLPAFGGIPVLGIIVALPIFMVGHLFNIGISTLGAYVHNCRLQYIEFFGKFYAGAGHLFVPLGSRTKYTYIDNTSLEKEATERAAAKSNQGVAAV
ncbi:MAG: V-type ATP synthase subunit I [Clostridia bacterium]|nr:V-type ATP synthase subunit I [Clostridia bacterium]